MLSHRASLQELLHAAASGFVPDSVAHVAQQLEPLTIGLRQKVPVLAAGARLFRVRMMGTKPLSKHDVGPPPHGVAPIGRLNEAGESVFYLADSPDTAFAEARSKSGRYCLSEWRMQSPKVALANGGIPLSLLHEHFPDDFDPPGAILGGSEDEEVLALFRTLFTLPVETDTSVYRWSIACGLANGFAANCGRTSSETIDGNTKLSGRYPLSGIAYASVRKDKQAVNFAFNDLGITFLKLNHVQWVERSTDGYFSGIDYASTCDANGEIAWQGRAAHYVLQSGSAARLVKVADTVWNYEQLDGGLPEFS